MIICHCQQSLDFCHSYVKIKEHDLHYFLSLIEDIVNLCHQIDNGK